jgi:hypothetical protein
MQLEPLEIKNKNDVQQRSIKPERDKPVNIHRVHAKGCLT